MRGPFVRGLKSEWHRAVIHKKLRAAAKVACKFSRQMKAFKALKTRWRTA
jgi:hypothetical protein